MLGFRKKKIEKINENDDHIEMRKFSTLGKQRYAFEVLFKQFASIMEKYDIHEDYIICYSRADVNIAPLYFRYENPDDWELKTYIIEEK